MEHIIGNENLNSLYYFLPKEYFIELYKRINSKKLKDIHNKSELINKYNKLIANLINFDELDSFYDKYKNIPKKLMNKYNILPSSLMNIINFIKKEINTINYNKDSNKNLIEYLINLNDNNNISFIDLKILDKLYKEYKNDDDKFKNKYKSLELYIGDLIDYTEAIEEVLEDVKNDDDKKLYFSCDMDSHKDQDEYFQKRLEKHEKLFENVKIEIPEIKKEAQESEGPDYSHIEQTSLDL